MALRMLIRLFNTPHFQHSETPELRHSALSCKPNRSLINTLDFSNSKKYSAMHMCHYYLGAKVTNFCVRQYMFVVTVQEVSNANSMYTHCHASRLYANNQAWFSVFYRSTLGSGLNIMQMQII